MCDIRAICLFFNFCDAVQQLQGEPHKIPKAVLHQLCQRSGWDAPKFNKVTGKNNNFLYAVSVLRKASGRGKSRKAGGLITLELPGEGETFGSVEVLTYLYTFTCKIEVTKYQIGLISHFKAQCVKSARCWIYPLRFCFIK